MQHLPLPRHPSWTPPSVRLYTKQDYDGGDIVTYLSRNKLGEDIFTIGLLSPDPSSHQGALAILQTWTFFGVLSVVLGENVSPMAMYVPPAGEGAVPWIDTTILPDMVTRWIARTASRNLPLQQRKEEQSRAVRVFGHMSDVYAGIHFTLQRAQLSEPSIEYTARLDPTFYMATMLLYDYLDRALRIAYGPWGMEDSEEGPEKLTPGMPGSGRVLEHQMRAAGWCDAEANLLDLKLGPLENCFASFLDVPHPEKVHTNCTEWRCAAYQVDEAHYRTRHARGEDCVCEFVHASQEELAAVLLGPSQAEIPLVGAGEPQLREDGRLYARLESSGDGTAPASRTRFVAISHVWSDGLGNNRANAIPLCQFKRLRALVAGLYAGDGGEQQSVAFWLDTLCFPLAPQAAYDQALVRMKDSYRRADKVLVLDEYLLGVVAADVSLDEVLARIAVAPWNRRLWTLQEAQLARRDELFFQLADRPVGDAELLAHVDRDPAALPVEEQLQRWLFMSFYSVFREVRGDYATEEDDDGAGGGSVVVSGAVLVDRVLLAKDALTFRSTSQPEDEGLCLGNIVGVPAGPLVAARTHAKRMRVFWEAVAPDDPRHYHASIVFFAGPKLVDKGWRWAPATLMDGSVTSGQMAFRLLDGLVLGRSGLGLSVRLPALRFHRLLLRDLGHLFYLRVRDMSPAGGATVRHLVLRLGDRNGLEGDATRGRRRVFSKSMRFVVLLPFAPAEADRLLASAGSTDVMLATASLRGGNRIHLVMPAQIAAIDTIANDLSRVHEVDQQSGILSVAEVEPTLDEIARRPWITTTFIRNGLWHVD
ncbi:hypothetical protein MFIFM68171_00080 [Madurella fahalii]|uniref:Heterokaryon incompatibility domain-containing protein n=1 Tax=Madurella fahalii TaxID=1157608 RepID=A0ABQ0FX22_9PEZI